MAEASPSTLGQFEITGELGRGGMAVVYKGYQPSLDRHVAIKTLPADRTTRDMVTRFKREVSTMVQLNHTNIVQIIDSGEEQGLHYYAMEYVEGPDLKGLMKDGLTIDQAFDIALQICDGLGYAHKKGMIHRDVKPANVLFETSTGLAKIADFGIAKDVSMVTLTGTDVGMGTMNYMAPEQKQQARDVDHRADIYAVGVVIYEMFTGGKLPMGRFKMPSELTPGLPKSLDDVVAKCLEFNAEDRWASLEQVKAALDKARQDVGASGGQRLLSIRDAAEKTLTAVASSAGGQGGLVLGLCFVMLLGLVGLGGGGYYLLVVRGSGQVAVGPSPTASASPSAAPTASASESPQASPSASATQSPAASPSKSPVASPSPSKSPTPAPPASASPTASQSPATSPTQTPQPSPAETPRETPTQTPASPTPSAPQLTREQEALAARAETMVREVEELQRRWGDLAEVQRAGVLRTIPGVVAKLRQDADGQSQEQVGKQLRQLCYEARRDLDGLLKRRLKDVETLLGLDMDEHRRLVDAMQGIDALSEEDRVTRFGRLIEDAVLAEIQAYKVQAEVAFALAVQRGEREELEPLVEELKAIVKAPREQLLELAERSRQAAARVRQVGVPGDVSEVELLAELEITDVGLDALTSLCLGEWGGVSAIGAVGEHRDRGAYLLLLREAGGKLEVVARQRVSDGAYWVASAGRQASTSSFWVAENAPGQGLVIRYGFKVDGGVESLGELEQLEIDLDRDSEYIQDLATGVDGALYVLTNARALVYFGLPDARRRVGQVSLSGEFVELPLPQRVAPLLDGRFVVTGDERRNRGDVWDAKRDGKLWSTKAQGVWHYSPKLYDYHVARRGQRVRSEVSTEPLALVGLGERLLGVSYGVPDGGQFLQYANPLRRDGAPVTSRGPKLFLVGDVALSRGKLFVLDQPVRDQKHDRRRLRAYGLR